MATHPRILSIGTADPPYLYSQDVMLDLSRLALLGLDWSSRPEVADQAQMIGRLFAATKVEQRRSAVDLIPFFQVMPSTCTRMQRYTEAAYPLGRAALEACVQQTDGRRSMGDISDLVLVSCTGYDSPGLDILLSRDLELPSNVRRVLVGHMGCHGAMVGLRQALAATRAYPGATAAMLSVELTTLHFSASHDPEVLTSFALFGDAAAALLLGDAPDATGPEVVDVYCAADFSGAQQMAWHVTDQGFVMELSPRVPVTLRRNVAGVVEHLLQPHGLDVRDIAHWIVHPGGPSILEVVERKLELSAEQMEYSWATLRERGNCSSATVLLILDRLMRSGRPKRGEYGVMMAFGPGLTLETSLLRF